MDCNRDHERVATKELDKVELPRHDFRARVVKTPNRVGRFDASTMLNVIRAMTMKGQRKLHMEPGGLMHCQA